MSYCNRKRERDGSYITTKIGDKEQREKKIKVKFIVKFVKKKEHKNKVQVQVQDKVIQKDAWEEKTTLFLLSHFLLIHRYCDDNNNDCE